MSMFIGTLNPNTYAQQEEQIVYTPSQLEDQRLLRVSQYAADLLIAMGKLLAEVDPKSEAAIEARKLLYTKIN